MAEERLSDTAPGLEPEKEKNSPTQAAQTDSARTDSQSQSSSQSTETGFMSGGNVQFVPVYDPTSASDTPVSFRIIGPSGSEVGSTEEPPKKVSIREQVVSQSPQSRVSFSQNFNPDGSRRDSVKGKRFFL